MQRLAARLRHHDWLAAGIELVIVIAGILIALQVSNWNQDRQDAARGREYLQRIHNDLAANIKDNGEWRAFYQQVVAYGNRALQHAETGKLVDGSEWETVLAYYQAGQYAAYHRESVAFNEMVSAGDLRLIHDAGLRSQLAFYFASIGSLDSDRTVLNVLPPYRTRVRELTPLPLQHYVWRNCFRILANSDTQVLKGCDAPKGVGDIGTVLDRYAREPGLADSLRGWMANRDVAFLVDDNRRGVARELLGKVNRAIGGN